MNFDCIDFIAFMTEALETAPIPGVGGLNLLLEAVDLLGGSEDGC